jgi:hypothetical protein
VGEQLSSTVGASGIGSAAFDPADALQWIASLATSVTEVGPRTFHGLETTEYAFSTTWARVLGSGAASSSGTSGNKQLAYHVYFDSSGRPVGFTISIALGKIVAAAASSLGLSGVASSQQLAQLAKMKMTMELDVLSYSGSVKVTIPPASQVKNVSSSSSVLGGSGLSGL